MMVVVQTRKPPLDNSRNPLVDIRIVLGAGSVGSPAILVRSGKDLKGKLQNLDSNTLQFTDHDIFAQVITFSYNDPLFARNLDQ